MAVMHGSPGRYAKDEAFRRFNRMLGLLIFTACAGGYTLGWVSGWLRSWYAALGALVVGTILLGVLRLLDKPLNKVGRERIKYLRGAQGEAFVGWLLKQLPDTWHIFHGLQLHEASDIDHIVVGPGGLFCISTKSSRGLLSIAPDGSYLLNNRPTDHLKQVRRQTMELRDRLAGLLGRVPWIQPVLAMPLAWVEFDSFQSAVWVLHQDNLWETISAQSKRLNQEEVTRIVKALEMIEANAKSIYRQPAPETSPDPSVSA